MAAVPADRVGPAAPGEVDFRFHFGSVFQVTCHVTGHVCEPCASRNTAGPRYCASKRSTIVEAGALSIELARSYDLEEADEAQRAVMEDSFLGKLVIEP